MRNPYSLRDVLRGMLIYSTGDTVASLIMQSFSPLRLAGMVLVGGGIYALEIPRYFRFIDRRTAGLKGIRGPLARTGLALMYFNPLWIARHLLFIQLFSLQWQSISWDLLRIALLSFTVNIPIALVANFLIQNSVPLAWRFFASAVFSSLMAVYYALSQVLF